MQFRRQCIKFKELGLYKRAYLGVFWVGSKPNDDEINKLLKKKYKTSLDELD